MSYPDNRLSFTSQPHTQQDAERTSCMQIRMTENQSRVDFCQTHPHGPDHKRIQTRIAHKHTDT